MKQRCDECGNENMAHVEYDYGSPQRYDGVSEIACMNCGARYGRWCGIRLAKGEVEPRFCTMKGSGTHAGSKHGVIRDDP